ncbi:hypothetical protein NDU88_001249 [Pleurodeles waltl]|uniref:Uncharacterized protein n=1 Tax=Pleurodeles waltl TaxID=8319 RepID=A0AAV7L084_PLEWA|nr:hypothetical protein NDU88_001249 [Pleurodeles waltl]
MEGRKEEEMNDGGESRVEADAGDKDGRKGADEDDMGPVTLEGDITNKEDLDAERWKAARLSEKDPGAKETQGNFHPYAAVQKTGESNSALNQLMLSPSEPIHKAQLNIISGRQHFP